MAGSSKESGSGARGCGINDFLVFITALAAGTLCSLCSKIMLGLEGIGIGGTVQRFSSPLFQTFTMFLGMTGVLVLHFITLRFKLPFPGYNHENPPTIPWKMYFMFLAPTIFDLISTVLAMFGLKYVNVSIYQMLRGSSIVFVAMMKQFVFGHSLAKYKWIGIFYNVLSIVLVGLNALLSSDDSSHSGAQESNPALGISLILAGAFVQSLQYVFEERMMTATGDLPAAPPLLIIGMEGLWGIIICMTLLYPAAYVIKGDDHGSLENIFNSLTVLYNTPMIQVMFTIYFFSILLFNIFALLVTCLLDSVWRAILDNFRPIAVWGLDLTIFYTITTVFGEAWTKWCWIQLFGLMILLYGTGIYNAPNAGSIRLTGKFYDCFFDCTEEYFEAEEQAAAAAGRGDSRIPPTPELIGSTTPFYGGVSPLVLLSPAAQNRNSRSTYLNERIEMRALLNKETPYQSNGSAGIAASSTRKENYGSGNK